MDKTLCFTGPRPKKLFGYDKTKYIPLVDALVEKLEGLVKPIADELNYELYYVEYIKENGDFYFG